MTYQLKAGRGSYGIFRDGVRIATISTEIMDQQEVGELLAASSDLYDALYALDACVRLGGSIPAMLILQVRHALSNATKTRDHNFAMRRTSKTS